MNVVVVNDSASINGGAAKVALSEAKALAVSGHCVHLLCAVPPVAVDLIGLENLHVHLLDIHDVNSDPNRARAMTLGIWNPRAYRYMKELLHSLPAAETVVHVHSWTRALSSSLLKAAIDSDRGVVVTLHDYLMGCPQGTFFNQQEGRTCHLRPMGLSCLTTNCDRTSYFHKIWRSARKVVQDNIAGMPGKVRHFIYVSNSSLDVLRPFLPHGASYHHLPNPIDISRSEPVQVANFEEFCFAGRLTPEKGCVLFAKAAEAQRVRTRFIGDGPEWDAIVKINPSAQMAGWMGSSEVVNALRGARALVFPSVWLEVLGLTVLEAAALGVPAIVPMGCGAEESVIHGVTGLHFRSGDVSDLEAKISVMKDPIVADRLGKAAYDNFWSTSQWAMPTHIQRLESIYTEMLTSYAAKLLQ